MATDGGKVDQGGNPRHDGSESQPVEPIRVATTDPAVEASGASAQERSRDAQTSLRIETIPGGGKKDAQPRDRRATKSDPRRKGTSHQPDGSGHERDAFSEKQADEKSEPEPPRKLSLVKTAAIAAGAALLTGALAAFGYSHFFGAKTGGSSQETSRSKNHDQSQARTQSGSGSGRNQRNGTVSEAEGTVSSIPGFTSADDSGTLKQQIMDLERRIDHWDDRLNHTMRPNDETPPVLHTLQMKVGELAKQVEDVAALPAKFRDLDAQFEMLSQDLQTVRARVDAMSDESIDAANSAAARSPRLAAARAPAETDHKQSPTMKLGIDLLERGQYGQAREVFLRLQASQPEDARVWYFSALAVALATGNREGEAKKLVDKGIERERSGTPSSAEVDATLATRVPIEGIPWVNSLRHRALGSKEARK